MSQQAHVTAGACHHYKGTYSHRHAFHCQGVLSQLAVVLLQHLLGIIGQDRVAVLPGIGNVFLQQLHGQRIMSFITASRNRRCVS